MNEIEKQVNDLIEKATKSARSEDALRFSLAALNVANAKLSLSENLSLTKQ